MLQRELEAIVGERNVLWRASELLVYENDALPGYRRRPRLAVFPGTRDEVIAVVAALWRAGMPFVPRGAGTGLSGGAVADDIVVLGLQRLKQVLALNAGARTATVEPGVVNATLTKAATPFGLHYAPDPSSQTACTIGGNVAENAGGPHCLKYGVTLNHVLAATVLLPNGESIALEAPRADRAGYDLMGAFVGSEGCFGVALDVTVRLTPNPEQVVTLLSVFSSLDDAARAVSAVIAEGVLPSAFEMMDNPTIRAVEASIYAAGYPLDAAAVLLTELDGAAAGIAEDVQIVERLSRACGATDVRTATDAADRARLWQGRKKAFGALGRIAPDLVVQDAVVPRTRLAPILAKIAEIGQRLNVRLCNVFHAGDGNLHPCIPYDASDADESARVHAAMKEVMELCIAEGGSITGEHGVGSDKMAYMDRLFATESLDAMCRLRDAFDAERRANPGKVIPSRHCREWMSVVGVEA